MKSKRIRIPAPPSGFQADKDLAREIRQERIIPVLKSDIKLVLDFSSINQCTQSFLHALLSAPLIQYGTDVLDRIEFYGCNDTMKSLIELVIDYSLGGFVTNGNGDESAVSTS